MTLLRLVATIDAHFYQRSWLKEERMITSISVEGYKSTRKMKDLQLGPINVLVGANGSGKSNFISLFELIQAAASGLDDNVFIDWLEEKGGAQELVYKSPKHTKSITIGLDDYAFSLFVTEDGRLAPSGRRLSYTLNGEDESLSFDEIIKSHMPDITNQMVFHFHDTSPGAPIMGSTDVVNRQMLLKDGRNLAAFLLRIKEENPDHYSNIRDTIRLVAPFFDDFVLEPESNGNKIKLAWKEIGQNDVFGPYRLSDGTLRFMCLATLLLQPSPPPVIVIDEPDLGLHPYALSILAGLVKSVSVKAQVILATHSVELINEFGTSDIIVVEREDDQTVMRRLKERDLKKWLEDYSIGEIWKKNIIGGGPA